MACDVVKKRDGSVFLLCSRGRRARKCQFCAEAAEFECDALRPRKKSGHCDARMCAKHRTKVGDQELGDEIDTIDHCPKCSESAAG